jgi:hypothetical protein
MFLPAGFIPNQAVTADDGIVYPAGKPLDKEIIVPIGTIFPVPFSIPKGFPLSNTWSPDPEDDSEEDGSLIYLPGDFWTGPFSVSCSFPCTLVFPPVTTTTSWDPPPFVATASGVTTTVDPPLYTTQLIRVSKTTVTSAAGSSPTKTIQPEPADKPMCFTLDLIIIKIEICPPKLDISLPPLPKVSIGPLPPGGKPGPTTQNNKPTPDQVKVRGPRTPIPQPKRA